VNPPFPFPARWRSGPGVRIQGRPNGWGRSATPPPWPCCRQPLTPNGRLGTCVPRVSYLSHSENSQARRSQTDVISDPIPSVAHSYIPICLRTPQRLSRSASNNIDTFTNNNEIPTPRRAVCTPRCRRNGVCVLAIQSSCDSLVRPVRLANRRFRFLQSIEIKREELVRYLLGNEAKIIGHDERHHSVV
jgi:hypothetical protein